MKKLLKLSWIVSIVALVAILFTTLIYSLMQDDPNKSDIKLLYAVIFILLYWGLIGVVAFVVYFKGIMKEIRNFINE